MPVDVMDNLTITVKHLSRGQQPDNYRPHVWESEITITGAKSWDRLNDNQLKNLIKALVHPFTEEPSDGSMDAHFRPRLTRLTKVIARKPLDPELVLGPHREVWRARVEIPYND